ncbi:beta-L-arabinofuranosidase domain-containing protein [Mucilaginibacter boryungensis]|uniref:Glycoside hydrolase family 127 protein n=1 Tax=Mucilaginibacter boryungensis TaxID=768480 RepID=A0ABR9XIV8_9SPHI|nr:beta-L-arabinofuranosidase domain-containing protein [Mucilaginibacter boryungensis]MBE9667160.1 glycoside hydrolase family 127 protein [Mucilaginibacter boryungensis]
MKQIKRRVIGMALLMFIHATYGIAQVNGRAAGELAYRINMAYRRLTENVYKPVFTEKFILADVNIEHDNARRFYNFSGDLSGRYIEVMSLMGENRTKVNLHQLVKDAIKYQGPDGRFGDQRLIFSEDQIGKQHMALLWGNGRMLVGLLAYYNRYHDKEVLAAAVKLGDFFIKAYGVCAAPEIVKRLDGFGATGIICVTQFIEGLVTLSQLTGDHKYSEQASKAYKLLPDRGKQHSHGYLTTLRGVLMLYDYDKNAADLTYVKNAYDNLIASGDYTIFGSVREYFGKDAIERDEGCSTADFVRLSLGLYKVTGEVKYLEKGELALFNALFFNQYYTGDFGHHIITETGSEPHYLHAAWWCCTMHGLRALYDVQQNYIINNASSKIKVDLYLDVNYKSKDADIAIQRFKKAGDTLFYQFQIRQINKQILFRMPGWASNAVCYINGKKEVPNIANGYISFNRAIKADDRISIGFLLKKAIITASGENIPISEIKGTIKGVLHYGPYILGVDDKADPDFTAEPNNNILYSKSVTLIKNNIHHNLEKVSFLSDTYLSINYQHGGYPSSYQTVLRPISELTFDRHGYLLLSITYATDKNATDLQRKDSMQNPWRKK